MNSPYVRLALAARATDDGARVVRRQSPPSLPPFSSRQPYRPDSICVCGHREIDHSLFKIGDGRCQAWECECAGFREAFGSEDEA